MNHNEAQSFERECMEITAVNKKTSKEIINMMSKKYSSFNKTVAEIWEDGQLIEIKLLDSIFLGKCFINKTKRDMYWRPHNNWYINIPELDSDISFDLLQNKSARIVPTTIQLNTFFENKVKEINKRGRFHLHETQKAWIDLQKLKGE